MRADGDRVLDLKCSQSDVLADTSIHQPDGLRHASGGSFFGSGDAALLGERSRDLKRLVDDGSVARTAGSLYRFTNARLTAHYSLATLCARVPGAIACLLSTLTSHGLGTQLPRGVWSSLPRKARTPSIVELSDKAVRISGSSLRYGVGSAEFEEVCARITSPVCTFVDCSSFGGLGQEIWRSTEVSHARSLAWPPLEVLSI